MKNEGCRGVKALAEGLGVAISTAEKYLQKGIYSDVDLPRRGRPSGSPYRSTGKRQWPNASDKRYIDFIEEMESWNETNNSVNAHDAD